MAEYGGMKRVIKNFRAFKKIKREDFVLPQLKAFASLDHALPILKGQTISQPTTVAFMLELLKPKRGNKVLDVGSGSGWTTALLAELVGPQGKIYGVEKIPELVKFGKNNVAKYDFQNIEILPARKKLGLPGKSPFDRILVSAAAKKIPNELLEQLNHKGIMVIPVGSSIFCLKKHGRKTSVKEYPGFVFVPLVDNS